MNKFRYRVGLDLLETVIEPDDRESLNKFDTHKDALLRHLQDDQLFGGGSSDIARDISALNDLARDICGHSFNDLCVSREDIETTLLTFLRRLPFTQARQVAARVFYNKNRISERRLSENKAFLQGLITDYRLPVIEDFPATGDPIGPEIDWHGPDDRQLQSFFRPQPDMLDMGLLKQAVEHSSAICLLTIPSLGRTGTGFMVAPGRVLTNYHLLKASEDEDLNANARSLRLSFGYLTDTSGREPVTVGLSQTQAVLSCSPSDALDYVLMQVADENRGVMDKISPVHPASRELTMESGLYILQHPQGAPMKLALDNNGLTGIYPQSGRVQYATRASPGSSGAPCFNDDWQVVALHHAERSSRFGTIREGILWDPISKHISSHLT